MNGDWLNILENFYIRNTYNIVLYIETGIVYFKPINGTFLFLVYWINLSRMSSLRFLAFIGNDDANT